jgi:hypothetical protein
VAALGALALDVISWSNDLYSYRSADDVLVIEDQ